MKTVYTLPKSRILLLLFVLTLTAFIGAFSVSAQQIGDYRSNVATMNWTDDTSWQIYTSTGWITVTNQGYPGELTTAGAVTIQAGHNVTADFTTNTNILYNNLPAVTTPNPIGKLTINTGGTLTLPGQNNNEIIFYIKTPEISVIPTTGTINFVNKADLALPTDAVVSLSTGGLSGTENANVKIYIGSLWYAVGVSNSAQYTFQQLENMGGTINAEITTPPSSTICQGEQVSLQGYFTGAYTSITSTATTPYGATYYWYDTHDGGTKTQIATGTIQLSTTTNTTIATAANASHTAISQTLLPGTHNLEFYVVTYVGTTAFYNSAYRTVVVRPTPTATISVSATTVCQGSTPAPNITFTNPQTLPVTVTYNINNGTNTNISVQAKSGTTNGTNTVSVPTTTAGTFTYNLVSVQYQDAPNCPNNITGQSATVTVNPNAAIALTSGSSNQTLCANTALTPITYSVTGGGTSATVSGLPSGVTGSYSGGFFTISGTPTVSGTFNYTVTTTGTCTQTTATGTITVNPTTTITSQSTATQTVCQNSSFSSISVTATGHNLSYQWYSNTTNSNSGGTSITGATNSSYTPASTSPGTLYYYCVVNGTCGTATSAVSGAFTVTPLTTITTQPVSKEVCPGTNNVSLSVAATGTGTLTYQWYINTTASTSDGTPINDATSASFTTTLNTPGTYFYYCEVIGGCGTVYSTPATVTIKQNQWTGATSNEWNVAANWTCKVPDNNEDVIFSTSVSNDLILDQDRTIKDLTNSSGKALVIPTGRTLTVGGTATNNAPERLLIKSEKDAVNGSLIFTNPSSNENVQATVELYSKAYKGDPQTFADANTGGTYTVSYRWQYFGIPVQTAVYNTVFEATSPVSYVRRSDETLNGDAIYYNEWVQLFDIDPLSPFTGYEITQNVTQAAGKKITFKGALVTTANQTLTLTKTTSGTTYDTGSGYNIFGNSYTAAIAIPQITFGSGVEQTVYLYNTGSLFDWYEATANTSSPGSYLAIPKSVSGEIQKEIPSMQGFMLIAESNNSTVTIPYTSVINNSVQQRVKSANSNKLSYLTADVVGKSGGDRVWLFSQPETSRKYDNGWDGRKIILNPGFSLYVDEGKDQLQVSTSDNLDKTYLAFRAGNDTEYTLKINKTNLTDYQTLYLTDLATKTVVDLSALNEYSYAFTASNTAKAERRFLITTKDKKVSTKTVKVKIYSTDKTLFVDNPSDQSGEVLIYDMYGQLRQSGELLPATTTEINTTLPPSVYLVRVKSAGIDQSDKIFIRK